MITEEEYQKALRVVEDYEYQQKVENEPDDDEYDDDPEECDDCGRMNCICDYVNNCSCGAWKWGNNGPMHVADCICGGGLWLTAAP